MIKETFCVQLFNYQISFNFSFKYKICLVTLFVKFINVLDMCVLFINKIINQSNSYLILEHFSI